MGDILFVAINTDRSAQALSKGPNRPINTAEDRATVLSSIRYVDGVIAFDSSTPVPLLEQLKPEVYVKGGDYEADSLPETPVVRGYGGLVVILPLLPGRSTTNIVERCKSNDGV